MGLGSRNRTTPPRTCKDASKHTCLCVIPAPTPCNMYHSFEVLGSLASSPAHDFIATVPPEQRHLQGFFRGYTDVYACELCLLLQDKLQEEGRSCNTSADHLLLFTN